MAKASCVNLKTVLFGFGIGWLCLLVNSSQSLFERIDNNSDLEQDTFSVIIGRIWHQCSLDEKCNFVAKRSSGSMFEKKQSIDAVDSYFAVWRRVPVTSFSSCKDAYASGIKENGLVSLSLPGLGLLNSYCDMKTSGGGWTVFQRRVDDTVDFDRNWDEYKRGFGEVFGNFWLGLDALHQLTNNGATTLRIDLKHKTGEIGYAEYKGFKVGDEASKYLLTLGEYSTLGTVGDAMTYSKGEQFSTKDQDNDKAEFHCAASWKGGWWHNACFEANLNNNYYNSTSGDPVAEMPRRMSWKTWKNEFGDITFSEMKLRKDE
ncbi:fibrinogen-like protein A [Rhopilema esculentum]|uniref:fibrinogen-like protein A n=1 Tax=Rhopilema esculentum TaxID=499914 RepID=UPI0031CF439B|eukprot:gene3189-1502_t